MEEQGFQNEFDDIDSTATHLVLFDGDVPAAVCRFFPGEEPGVYIFGRLAVRKDYRGRHLGSIVLPRMPFWRPAAAPSISTLRSRPAPSIKSRDTQSMAPWTMTSIPLTSGCPNI